MTLPIRGDFDILRTKKASHFRGGGSREADGGVKKTRFFKILSLNLNAFEYSIQSIKKVGQFYTVRFYFLFLKI